MLRTSTSYELALLLALLNPVVTGCQSDVAGAQPLRVDAPIGAGLRARESGTQQFVAIGGSSTVSPLSEAVADAFRALQPARVTIGVSGTRGGFDKLCRGELTISGASRPIEARELQQCHELGVDFIELPVAYDGISVVVNPQNRWVDHLTAAELAALWRPEAQSNVLRWSQLRAGWPDEEIHLFGPGVDSGTYDYFTLAIVGHEHASRGDFTSSEDDNVLVRGVATDRLALGFFGYAYYLANRSRLALVAIDDERDDNGRGPIPASPASIREGTYSPLSRLLFIYVSEAASRRSEVDAFVRFYLEAGPRLVQEVGYVPLPERAQAFARQRYERRLTGSLFGGSVGSGASVEALLARQ